MSKEILKAILSINLFGTQKKVEKVTKPRDN